MLVSLLTHTAASILLSASPTAMADIYVDANDVSCGSGTGTIGSPVCSISSAIALAVSGDTIRIAPGTYTENLAIAFDLELIGTSGAAVTTVDGGGVDSVVVIGSPITVTIDGLTLTGGSALGSGGGILSDGDLVISNSTITGNVANGNGGGISISVGALSITNSTVSGNQANYGNGGGIFLGSSSKEEVKSASALQGLVGPSYQSLTMSGTTISGNTCSYNGGGVYSSSAEFEIRNSTLSGNTAGYTGGGLAAYAPTLALLSNTTITANGATAYSGGGVSNSSVSPVSLHNTIVAGNSAAIAASADLFGYAPAPFASVGHNVVGVGGYGVVDGITGDQAGTTVSPLDALLGLLASNGGATGTHALLPGSPAIDAGDPLVFEPADQRGVLRPLDAASDVGAFEFDGAFSNFCNGDGGNQLGCTNCPCMNNAPAGTLGGCLNSALTSARLVASGDPSVSLPSMDTTDLRFALNGAPAGAFCILNSGDGVAPGNPVNPCFGLGSGAQAMQFDGLRCAIVNTRRHGGRSADVSGDVGVTNNPWGGEGAPPVGIANAGSGFVSGQTRYFQVINRDDVLLSCMRGLNTSQAIEITFTP